MKTIKLDSGNLNAGLESAPGEPTPPRPNLFRRTFGGTWKRRGVALGLGLALLLPLSFSALEYLAPSHLMPGKGVFARAGWYVSSGQWRADLRTLRAGFEYVMDAEDEVPATLSPTAKQVITPAPPSLTPGVGV